MTLGVEVFLHDYRCGTVSLPLPVGGGTGFVGRELIRLLRNKGHEVTLISRQPGPGKITWVQSQTNSKHVCIFHLLLHKHHQPTLPLCFFSTEGLGIIWTSTL